MSRDLPPGVVAFGPDATCQLNSCPLIWSVYQYRPNRAVNIFLGVTFLCIGISHAILGLQWRSPGFAIGMILGSILESVGYAGRVMLYYNPFSFAAFMLQIVCLTIAPVFYAASIYVTLSEAIEYFAPDLSRFRPKLFYWIFIPADVVCLILQAAGGVLSTDSGGDNPTGVDISLGGLALQVIVLSFFILAFGDYLFRYWRSSHTREFSWKLNLFFSGLSISVVLIFLRCVYRLIELKDGYRGEIITHEIPFIIFEGVFIIIAAVALCFGHPGFALQKKKPGEAQRTI